MIRLICFLLNAAFFVFSLSVLLTYDRDVSINTYFAYIFEIVIYFIFRCYLTANFKKLVTIMEKVSKLKRNNFKQLQNKTMYWVAENVLFHFIIFALYIYPMYRKDVEYHANEIENVLFGFEPTSSFVEKIITIKYVYILVFTGVMPFTTFCIFYAVICMQLSSTLTDFKISVQSGQFPNYKCSLRSFWSIKNLIREIDRAVSFPLFLYLVYFTIQLYYMYNVFYIIGNNQYSLLDLSDFITTAHNLYFLAQTYLAAWRVTKEASEISDCVSFLVAFRPSNGELSDILFYFNTDKVVHMTIMGAVAIKKLFLMAYFGTAFSYILLLDVEMLTLQ